MTISIQDDEAMSRRHERNDVAPQMPGRRKAVYEDNGIPGATRAGGVVIDPCAVEIEKLTAHASGRFAWGREDDEFRPATPDKATRAVTGVTARVVFRELG